MIRSLNTSKSLKNILVIIFFIFVIMFYIAPVYISFLYSIKSDSDVLSKGPLEFPTKIDFKGVARAVERINFFRTLFNTLFITITSVISTVFLGSLASYAIARSSRKKLFGSFYILFISGILVPYQAIIIPLYIMGYKMNFVNNQFGVIFLYIAYGIPLSVFLFVGFLKTIPIEIEESAMIDGCNKWKTFWFIVFPMLKPAIAAVAVLRALLVWNDFLIARLFLQKNDLQTFTVRLSIFFQQYRSYPNSAFGGIILASIPVILLYLFAQKYIIKGITAGSLKG